MGTRVRKPSTLKIERDYQQVWTLILRSPPFITNSSSTPSGSPHWLRNKDSKMAWKMEINFNCFKSPVGVNNRIEPVFIFYATKQAAFLKYPAQHDKSSHVCKPTVLVEESASHRSCGHNDIVKKSTFTSSVGTWGIVSIYWSTKSVTYLYQRSICFCMLNCLAVSSCLHMILPAFSWKRCVAYWTVCSQSDTPLYQVTAVSA